MCHVCMHNIAMIDLVGNITLTITFSMAPGYEIVTFGFLGFVVFTT